MRLLILVVDDEADVEALFRQQSITAYGDAETKRRAFEAGAEALLTRPIDFITVRNEIDARVGRAA